MAWNPCPEVAAARDFGTRFKANRVVITYITEDGKIGYASYGKTKELCAETKRLADALHKTAMEWFETEDFIDNEVLR
jgi:hypothetical protein